MKNTHTGGAAVREGTLTGERLIPIFHHAVLLIFSPCYGMSQHILVVLCAAFLAI